MDQLSGTDHGILAALSLAITQRDLYTGGHVNRIAGFATAVARKLDLPLAQIETIRYAAQLHDIGKLAIPTEILRKAGFLSRQEWDMIRQHPVIGSRILQRVPLVCEAAPLVLHHHERYDGAGYPAGLRGHDIPLGARIIAVADAFDAMVSDRPYRKAMTFAQAVAELRAEAGAQFDPELVRIFLKIVRAESGHGDGAEWAAASLGELAGDALVADVISDNGHGHVDVE